MKFCIKLKIMSNNYYHSKIKIKLKVNKLIKKLFQNHKYKNSNWINLKTQI